MAFTLADLVYRTAGVWGAGNGGNLNGAQFDNNTHSLRTVIQGILDTPPVANQIASITVTDGNQLHFTLEDDTEFGPFTLPIAEFRDRGEWTALTDYLYGDIFTQGVSIYFVLSEHTSAGTFNPDATDGFGPLYRLLFDGTAATMRFLPDGYPVEGEDEEPVFLKAFDVFSIPDEGLYMALSDHEALASFDPDALDVDDNPLYILLFAAGIGGGGGMSRKHTEFQFTGLIPSDGSLMWKFIQADFLNLIYATDFAG